VLFADDGMRVSLTPIWHALYWPILVLSLIGIANDVLDLYRPNQQLRAFVRIAAACAGIAVAALLLTGGPWLAVDAPSLEADRLASVLRWANVSVVATPVLTAVFIATDGLLAGRSLAGQGRAARMI
jgi:hypothetical protein